MAIDEAHPNIISTEKMNQAFYINKLTSKALDALQIFRKIIVFKHCTHHVINDLYTINELQSYVSDIIPVW